MPGHELDLLVLAVWSMVTYQWRHITQNTNWSINQSVNQSMN